MRMTSVITAVLVLKSTPPRHRLPRLLSASWGTARDSTCRRTSAGIRSPGRARRRTRTRTHAAEHLSAHLHPVRACAAHPACPPSERSVRTRRGREGAALTTCARENMRACAEMRPRLRAACASPATRPPAPHSEHAIHSTQSSLVWNLAMPRAVPRSDANLRDALDHTL